MICEAAALSSPEPCGSGNLQLTHAAAYKLRTACPAFSKRPASYRGSSAGPYHADVGRGDSSDDISQLVIQNCVPQSKCHHS